jgi:hypothetical protein
MLRFDSKPSRDMEYFAQEEMDEAREGGALYFIIAQLDFSSSSAMPKEISITMYNLSSANKIHEKKITGKSYRTENDEMNDYKSIIRGIVPLIR